MDKLRSWLQQRNTDMGSSPALKSGKSAFDDYTKQPRDTDTETESPALITLKNIHKTYLLGLEGIAALRGITLSIHKSEWIVIYGTSGGGKTSLLNILGTIDKPTKGELIICGTRITDRTSDDVLAKLRLGSIGFVFQSFNLLGGLSACENVEVPMRLRNELGNKERRERSLELLDRVGLAHRVHQLPGTLSGGEQQRVTIARAIANRPEILLLDEPTGDLDTENTYKIIDLLRDLNAREGVTLIMVTHDVYLKNFANRVIYIRDGKVSKQESIHPETRQKAFKDLGDKITELENKKHVNGQSIVVQDVVTETRQPSDYETYSPRSGVPGVVEYDTRPAVIRTRSSIMDGLDTNNPNSRPIKASGILDSPLEIRVI